jgi:hypothetical protein
VTKTIAVSAARVQPCVPLKVVAWLLHVETVNRLPFLESVTNVEDIIAKALILLMFVVKIMDVSVTAVRFQREKERERENHKKYQHRKRRKQTKQSLVVKENRVKKMYLCIHVHQILSIVHT